MYMRVFFLIFVVTAITFQQFFPVIIMCLLIRVGFSDFRIIYYLGCVGKLFLFCCPHLGIFRLVIFLVVITSQLLLALFPLSLSLHNSAQAHKNYETQSRNRAIIYSVIVLWDNLESRTWIPKHYELLSCLLLNLLYLLLRLRAFTEVFLFLQLAVISNYLLMVPVRYLFLRKAY